MSSCRFRLADMMPNTWFHRFKHVSSRRHDPSTSSLHRRHSNGPILVNHYFDFRRRSYGGRSGRRRCVRRASTSLGRRVASSPNQGPHSSPAPGLVPPVTGTAASTNKADLTPAELDSSRDSVEIEYMDTGGVLSSSFSSSPYSNLLHEKFSSSTMHLVIELDELHSTRTMDPEANIADKEESCKIEHMDGRASSRGNKGVKLRQNTPVIGKTRKSQARIWRRFSSTSPTTSHVMVRFANKNIGESLAKVKYSSPSTRQTPTQISSRLSKRSVPKYRSSYSRSRHLISPLLKALFQGQGMFQLVATSNPWFAQGKEVFQPGSRFLKMSLFNFHVVINLVPFTPAVQTIGHQNREGD